MVLRTEHQTLSTDLPFLGAEHRIQNMDHLFLSVVVVVLIEVVVVQTVVVVPHIRNLDTSILGAAYHTAIVVPNALDSR